MDDKDKPATENSNEFKYVLGEKDDVLLVLLYGKFGSREVEQLEQCENEVKEKDQTIVIVSFRDLISIAPGVYAPLAKFQKTIRDHRADLAICGLKPEIKIQLLANGIIRESEMFNNIPEAWEALKKKRAA